MDELKRPRVRVIEVEMEITPEEAMERIDKILQVLAQMYTSVEDVEELKRDIGAMLLAKHLVEDLAKKRKQKKKK